MLWLHSSGVDETVNRKQSAFQMFEVVGFQWDAHMQIFFVNKVFIISESTLFGCVLQYIACELVYLKSLR